MSYKQFAERLNKELDTIGLPLLDMERIDAFAKLLKIPKFKAQALLNGFTLPDAGLLDNLGDELEVNPQWLVGNSDQRKKSVQK